MSATIFAHRAIYGRRVADCRETFYERLTSALLTMVMSCAAVTTFLIAVWVLLREEPQHSIFDDDPLGGPTANQIRSDANLLLEPLAVTTPMQPIIQDKNHYESLLAMVGKLAIDDVRELPDYEYSEPGADGVTSVEDVALHDDRRTDASIHHQHRWVFLVTTVNTRADYVRLLKGLKIDVAVVYVDGRAVSVPLPGEGGATSLSSDDSRFFTTWIDGGLAELDAELCRSAGVYTGGGTVVHFFDPSTEAHLERLERDFAGRQAEDIGRTWFQISRSGSEYVVSVVRQTGTPRP